MAYEPSREERKRAEFLEELTARKKAGKGAVGMHMTRAELQRIRRRLSTRGIQLPSTT
jgi:uncharacterized protein (DUF2267 family)